MDTKLGTSEESSGNFTSFKDQFQYWFLNYTSLIIDSTDSNYTTNTLHVFIGKNIENIFLNFFVASK